MIEKLCLVGTGLIGGSLARDLKRQTICQQGSITRAAELLFMSQPTLSKKLARLEKQLNTQLFHRSPTGLVPTDVTRYIVDSAKPIEDQLKRIERHVEQLTQLETGEVRLGVGPIIEQVLLPEVLPQFVEATGNVHISIMTDHAETLLNKLYAAELDVIAGPFGSLERADLAMFPLINDGFVTVARTEHPIFSAQEKPKLSQFPFAAPPPQGAVAGPAVPRSMGQKRISSDNYPLLKNLTLNSDCICGGPRYVFRDELASGTLREVETRTTVNWRSACLVRPESVEVPLVKLLVKLIVDSSKRYYRK
ncbi:MAG: LysR substrate-binding domain-containing protein [Pseudomonadota bacterium]